MDNCLGTDLCDLTVFDNKKLLPRTHSKPLPHPVNLFMTTITAAFPYESYYSYISEVTNVIMVNYYYTFKTDHKCSISEHESKATDL